MIKIINKNKVEVDIRNHKIVSSDTIFFVCSKCGKNSKKLGQYALKDITLCKECKREKTNLKKYGYKTSTENENVLLKRREKRIKKSFEVIKKRLQDNNLLLLEKYIGTRTGNRKDVGNEKKYYTFKCITCGSVFKDHLFGKRIPVCKQCFPSNRSKGENKIYNFLKKENISFINEKTFENCKDTNLLPFDFYLPEHNTLIEYDGRHHFEIIKHFGGEEKFKKTVLHDKIKNEFAEKNEYNLIRISYKDYNKVEKIVMEVI